MTHIWVIWALGKAAGVFAAASVTSASASQWLEAAAPLGILLALGRRSTMPIVSLLSTIFIEVVRGVPLVLVLFMAANMSTSFWKVCCIAL